MINCLIPVWAILAVGLFQTIMRARPVLTLAAAAVVVGVGLFVQISSYFEWQRTQAADPEEFALNTLMPQTLEWLNRYTPPGSVLLAPVTITSSLPLFTHNRSYIAHYALQYVMSNRNSNCATERHRPGAREKLCRIERIISWAMELPAKVFIQPA